MKKKEIPLEDQETILNYSKYHLGDRAELYTTDKLVMKRYFKFSTQHPELCTLVKEDDMSMTFSLDLKVALYPKAPRKVKLSEEQKQKLRDRMTEIRKKN